MIADPLADFSRAAGLHVADEAALPVVVIKPALDETANQLAQIVSRLDLFQMNGELVYFDHAGEVVPMNAVRFRTWINRQGVITCRKYDKTGGMPVPESMFKDEAATILEDTVFRRSVRPLAGVNHVRCPVLREGGKLDWLPWGYDAQTRIYTIPGGLEYGFDLDWEAAKGRFLREFQTFPFVDERAFAVQVAAMMVLYIRHLPGGSGLRPGTIWYANGPGTGKSVLAKAAQYPVMGRAPAAKLKRNEDLDKEMEAFSRASMPCIFFDNIYGGINSATIDQFLTSEESTGRAMGGHGVFVGKNSAWLCVTGNQLDLNEDVTRRLLVVDLFEKGKVGERKFEAELDDGRMKSEEWRRSMLECMAALVRRWHDVGMPRGTFTLPSFETFARLLGGILESSGYVPPFTPYVLPDAKTPGEQDFEALLAMVLEEMGEEKKRDFSITDLCRLARAGQLYQRDVGTQEEGKKMTIKEDGISKEHRAMAQDMGYMNPSQASAFGKRIAKFAGKERTIRGVRLVFGKREQSRKATYTMEVL